MKKILLVFALLSTFYCTDVVKGTVLNDMGDGHCDWAMHGVIEPFSYINYANTDGRIGEEMITFYVYEPWNTIDGIVYRKDVVLR